ncbi:hypothetical protein PSHT_14764 [Puccinia striiformis]|uniref:DDE Tnp4 domain-containing protein n=1 Tax=Puccinia striiformis TaxID=27350 RepID=A0A2S4UIQ1_9BASI|nr:hypothetical protein PSHT_14764 [Puccinia striiformis]
MLNLSATQKAVLALFAIFLMSELDEEDLQPYYSDGGKATHVRFLLHEARPELFREATGLERPTFDALVKEVTSKGLLEDGRYFHRFLEVLVTLYPKYVNLTPKEDVSERLSDPKYHSFKKCLGALDGVMIPITLPMSQQPAYRNRKGFIAQNVIAVCNFDLKFLYVLAGWEGSAHDSRVIADAFNKGLSIPEGQFYLADAGYALQKGLITPFRGVRYHLKEQATCSLKPANPKELFNLRHASLRNVVERIFGCLKSKFKILTTPSEHNIHSQVQLVYAITMLWNFLRHHDQYEEIPDLEEREDSDEEIDEDRSPNAPGKRFRRSRAEDAAQVSKQNRMSEKMWNQYQQHCSQKIANLCILLPRMVFLAI